VYRDDATVGDALAAVVARFETKIDEIAERNSARQRAEIDGLDELDAPALWEIHRRLTRESRRIQARHLLRNLEPPETCPEPDVEAADLAVRGSFSLADTLKGYRIGHVCTMEAWLEAIEETELEPDIRARCIALVTRYATEYDDRIADLVSREYARRQQQHTADLDHSRLGLVRALIEGREAAASELAYPVELHHIGFVASGDGADAVIQELASSLDHQRLVVPAEDGVLMGWLGSTKNGLRSRALLRRFAPPPGVRLAIGNVRSGYPGLRRSHREASDAHLVSLRRPRPITFYDDVILEVLALRDARAAREFIDDVLGGLHEDDAYSERLRTTLAAYFRAEQNAVAAAASLGVHAVTVGRHLDQIETRVGYRVNQRRAELESALRLRALLLADPQSATSAS
jgi:hypothetical protein